MLSDLFLKVQYLSLDEADTGRANLLEDTIRSARGLPGQAHLGGRFAMGARVAQQYAVPAEPRPRKGGRRSSRSPAGIAPAAIGSPCCRTAR